MKFSSKIEKCGLSPMRKFAPYANEAAKKGKKLYHLNIGQPDIATPEAYFEAVKNFSQPVLAYAPSDGVPEMIDAVVNYYGKIDAPITNKQVLITTGGSEALQIALSCILDEGDEIIIPAPIYPNSSPFVPLTGAPNRPLPGTMLTVEELRLMADIAKEHNLFIIGDEAYREFVYGGEKLMSLLQLEGYEDNVVVIDSVSKRFSACGARIGCVITRNAELYNNAMKWCQGRLCASTSAQVASAALSTAGPEYFDAVRKEYKARRDTLVEGLKKIPGVIYSEPKGAFYVMAKLPVDDAEKFQLFMLEEFDDNGDTLMFTPAESFYKTPHTGVNEIRMAYVINQDDLKRSMELLAKGIEAYNNK